MQLLEAVADDFRDELERLLEGGALSIHCQELLRATERRKPDLTGLFRYGIERLPPDDARPDDALAAFFIVLSELRHCSPELRILATKCVEYCESDALDGWGEPPGKLKEGYVSLADHLRAFSR